MILTVIWANEPGTLDLHGFEEGFQPQSFGGSLSGFWITGEAGIYGSSEMISCSMGRQRLTRLVS